LSAPAAELFRRHDRCDPQPGIRPRFGLVVRHRHDHLATPALMAWALVRSAVGQGGAAGQQLLNGA